MGRRAALHDLPDKSFRFNTVKFMKNKTLGMILFVLYLLLFSCGSTSQRLIVLMTDFGEKDFYVGAIKGAIYAVNPDARIDDISNNIPKFDIEAAAYTLLKSAVEFPRGTIFVIVVDPGVGTARKPVIVKTTDEKYFIAPDNGVLTRVIEEFGLAEIREISNPDVMQKEKMSSTFHGRDIFGPAAAHLSRGFPMEKMGAVMNNYVRLTRTSAKIVGKKIVGRIVTIDDYGNTISNIPKHLFEKMGWRLGDSLAVKVGEREFTVKFVNAYGDVATGEYLGLFGSGGVFEVSINQGNMAEKLRLNSGDRIEVSVNQP